MFTISRNALIIGGNIWVVKFDPLVTSLKEIGLPKQAVYMGRYSFDDGSPSHIEISYPEKKKNVKIYITDDYEEFYTGFYILSKSRQDIFYRISTLQHSNSSPNIKQISKLYVKYLKENHPEFIL